MDSGADHHFISKEAVCLKGENCGGAKALRTATGETGICVNMCKLGSNTMGLKGVAAHSEALRYSLLSVSKLVKDGWVVAFGKNAELVCPSGARYGMCEKNGLYWVATSCRPVQSLVTKVREHERRAHFWDPSKRGVRCDACDANKGQSKTHKNARPEYFAASKKGESVHFDHVGPMEVVSTGGSIWVLNCVDDYDGWVESYPSKKKTDAAAALEEFIDKHGKPEIVRTDRDPTFAAPENSWVKTAQKHGIKTLYSFPHTPQQNGKIERYNRTLTDAIRTATFGVDKQLWRFAAKYVAYTWNRTDGNRKSPYFLRYGREPGVKHLRRFGSKCWFKIQRRKKLGQKYKLGVFLGYAEVCPSYLVGYYTDAGRFQVAMSADVKFDEDDLVSSLDALKRAAKSEALRENHIAPAMDTPHMGLSEAKDLKDLKRSGEDLDKALEGEAKRAKTTEADEDVVMALGTVTAKEARTGPESDKWKKAEAAEREALERMKVWEPFPAGEKANGATPIPIVLLYNKKSDGRHKARAVVLGNRQSADDVKYACYSPTVSHVAIRMALVEAARMRHSMKQFDISNAFVNAPLSEEECVVAKLPKQWGGSLVRLRKALYGLKSAPRHWYDHFTDTLVAAIGWERSAVEPGTFRKQCENGTMLTLVLYVDDGVICGPEREAEKEREKILNLFPGKKLDPVVNGPFEIRTLLGTSVKYNPKTGFLSFSQESYARQVVSKFDMTKWEGGATLSVGHLKNEGHEVSKDTFDYRSCVGSLNYLVAMTRPDLAWSVSQLSKFLTCPRDSAVMAAARVLRYIAKTAHLGITYRPDSPNNVMGDSYMVGFCDSDYAGCPSSRKSTTGCIVYFYGCPIWWRSSLQPIVTTSSAEAEYVALYTLVKELAHLSQVARFIRVGKLEVAPVVLCDNGSTVVMAKSTVATKRSRHIDVRWHYVREQLKGGSFKLQWVPTKLQKADSLTKPRPGHILAGLLDQC